MSHVTYMILLGLPMEYLGPSMTAPPSHVTKKNSIFGPKIAKKSRFSSRDSGNSGENHVTYIRSYLWS